MTTSIEPREVVWAPHPGSQTLFLSCPYPEAIYTGTRGPGKTDALLMDFAQHVGQGWGEEWRGILFREEYKPLGDVVAKSKKWFRRIFPGARWLSSKSDYKWVWPTGEELLFRAMRTPDDYWDYHGHNYPWIGFEELTAWLDLRCYQIMAACNRSTAEGIPLKRRATTNPWGRGHNAVKAYCVDPAPAGVPFVPPRVELDQEFEDLLAGMEQPLCVRIRGHYSENLALMRAQPNYAQLIAAAADSPEMAKAWLSEDWDVVAGGMFDDLWRARIHVLSGERAWIPKDTPASWRIDRAYDWGSSRPFSLSWWAESDGTDAPNGRIYPRGTLVRLAELYGWNGKPNEGLRMTDEAIARWIVQLEAEMGIRDRVRPGPADTMIYDVEPGQEAIADKMARHGIRFTPADKKPGSRKTGWGAIRERLEAAKDGDKERAQLYVMDSCRQFIRTVPTLARSTRDPDDVNTDAEDHVADETRYRVMAPRGEAEVFEFRR